MMHTARSVLHTSPFSSPPLALLHLLSSWLLLPGYHSFGGLMCGFRLLSSEFPWQHWFIARTVFVSPVFAFLMILTLPLTALGWTLRMLTSPFRNPFVYCSSPDVPGPEEVGLKPKFSICTTNLCLLPDACARFNNLSDGYWRAGEIASRIVSSQQRGGNLASPPGHIPSKGQGNIVPPPAQNGQPNGPLHGETPYNLRSRKGGRPAPQNAIPPTVPPQNTLPRSDPVGEDEFSHAVESQFPALDFLCCQEVFDQEATRRLVAGLQRHFGHVIYEPGRWSWSTNIWAFHSGLLFASRYPVLAAEFRPFSAARKQDRWAAKGALMVKVFLGKTQDGQEAVGYITTTHMQSYQGPFEILPRQLDELLTWTEDFRRRTLGSDDIQVFDILCGDFNFDNMSPGEKTAREHPLMEKYVDVCRAGPGRDKPWTIGTELRQCTFWETSISTPEKLRATLRSRRLQARYLLDGDVTDANMDMVWTVPEAPAEEADVPDIAGRRRIDYVMYRPDGGRGDLCVERYTLVTQLARLTDHIPVCLTFNTAVS
ncbi:PREDICTED: sphingomyelin phosphodiesterase 5-like [Branchiostoma belcheri]|uniref:sphingomyelin phosphodiesterase n=1 Tax=Branchiostoma belcheri TaxID=7741 RepID=A0A6P5AV83_BRABE|nr:PREDICTED: sphingomyelin phosphodiesterase 5-like [Branchiostoma belcheri]